MTRLVTALFFVAFLPLHAVAVSVTITRLDDPLPPPRNCTNPQNLDCSLRGAILEVVSNAALDREVAIPPGKFPLDGGVLFLGGNVKLVGSGAGSTRIDALGKDRAMGIVSNAVIEVSGVTIMNGSWNAPGDGGAAIYNGGTLTMTDCVVRDSKTRGEGGGIANVKGPFGTDGKLTLIRTTIVDNAGVGGGGIANLGGVLTAIDCTIDGNVAEFLLGGAGRGAGVLNTGTATFTGCTISNNGPGLSGGGFVNDGAGARLTLVNSTVTGNFCTAALSARGGGIFAASGTDTSVVLKNTTVTENDCFGGGGISAGNVAIQNSIIAGNRADIGGDDCLGVTSFGFNLIGNTSDCPILGISTSDVLDEDPLLGPLADNGGPTLTHGLLPGSPAIDAANPAAAGGSDAACPTSDQRGVVRPMGAQCDIGAFEVEVPTTPTTMTTTTTTLPAIAEICGDCIDNDGDGRTDLEDAACCGTTAGLTLRTSRLTPKKTSATLALNGTLAGLAHRASTDDLLIQLRAAGGSDFVCARIPAANLVHKGKRDSFTDRKHRVTSAGGIDAVILKEKNGNLVLMVDGTKLPLPLPPAGTLEVTMALRDPATPGAGGRCGRATVPLKAAKKGALKFP